MTDSSDQTTMEYVAAQLWVWDSANYGIDVHSSMHWNNLSDVDREEWHQKAVQLIDAAWPIWYKRVNVNLMRRVWDRAVEAVQKHINQNLPVTEPPLLAMEINNPYVQSQE